MFSCSVLLITCFGNGSYAFFTWNPFFNNIGFDPTAFLGASSFGLFSNALGGPLFPGLTSP
jgi:hypothetical protein